MSEPKELAKARSDLFDAGLRYHRESRHKGDYRECPNDTCRFTHPLYTQVLR